jgi:hypothetical protein
MLAEQSHIELTPLTMCSAIVECDQYSPGWTLAQVAADGLATRAYFIHVDYDVPFANIPMVQVGISGFDIDNRDTARLSARAMNITAFGFDLQLSTWRATRVYRVEISWIALGHQTAC